MPLGSGHNTITTSANFIPKMWSDEVIAVRKQKTVLADLVKNVSFKGKHGDTLYLPVPARGEASLKAPNAQVTIVSDTAGTIPVVIDKHFELSRVYEDIAEMQALSSMRRFYTDDAGYALARRIDRQLMLVSAGFQGGSIAGATNLFETGVTGGDGTTNFSGASNGNGTALTDAGFRKAIQRLEDNEIQTNEMFFVIPPVEAGVLRGVSRFTEYAFRGEGNALKTGKIGDVYGVEIYVTSNCPFIHANSVTNTQSVTFSNTTPTGASFADEFGLTVDWNTSSPTDTKYRACILGCKDAMVLATQQDVRTQAQYKQEYLGTLVTADTVFGTKELRDYAAITMIVPA